MLVNKNDWESLSAYIFLDRKIDSSSGVYLKSRYYNLCDFLEKNNLHFDRDSVNRYLQYKLDQDCKHSYLNNIIKVCQYVHEWLLQKGYDSGCTKLTYFKKQHQIFDILTPDECKRIFSLDYPYIRLREEKNYRFQTIYMMLTLTGMRIGELLNLKWSDVTETSIIIRETKTNHDRVIPNNALLFHKLSVYSPLRDLKNPFVFQGEDHLMMHKDAIRDDLKKRVKVLGITKRVWLHLFRHSFCVEMLRNNDVTIVAKLMGHESLSSTLSYTHYLLTDMENALMTHPLLKTEQSFEDITRRIQEYVAKIIDKNKNTVHIQTSKESFTVKVERCHVLWITFYLLSLFCFSG